MKNLFQRIRNAIGVDFIFFYGQVGACVLAALYVIYIVVAIAGSKNVANSFVNVLGIITTVWILSLLVMFDVLLIKKRVQGTFEIKDREAFRNGVVLLLGVGMLFFTKESFASGKIAFGIAGILGAIFAFTIADYGF